jgi:tight adherence protein C
MTGGTAWSLPGAGLGLLAGVGAWLVLSRWPALRRPSLTERLSPYLREGTASRLLRDPGPRGVWGPLERVVAPTLAHLAARIERLLGGSDAVRRRLDRLGGGGSVEQFRMGQVTWAAFGAGAGLLLGLALTRGRADVMPVAGLAGVGTVGGALARDWALGVQVRRRERAMLAEFPTVAELLALSVVAGEGAAGALDRVTRTCGGELSAELGRALAESRAGASLVDALEAVAARTGLPSLARFVDGIVVALERGTPLADVLRAQAQDVRALTRRQLMESGGKREVAMMVPVVFLILPVTVIFAVYPGLAVLSLDP